MQREIIGYDSHGQAIYRKPYAIYVHGFGSGAASGTKSSLARDLDDYEWLCPEITHDPFESLEILNTWAATFEPELIAGTSMGGMLALYVDCPTAVRAAVNPSMSLEKSLRRKGYGRHPYLCEREDGAKEYVIDEALCRRFIEFREQKVIQAGTRAIALFSTDDEVSGHEASKQSAEVLATAGVEILWSDKFGHRLNDKATKILKKALTTP